MLGIDYQHGIQETVSLEQILGFLEGSGEVRFQAHERRELYAWINQTLRQQEYSRLKRAGKVLVVKITGLSRAQVARAWCGATSKAAK